MRQSLYTQREKYGMSRRKTPANQPTQNLKQIGHADHHELKHYLKRHKAQMLETDAVAAPLPKIQEAKQQTNGPSKDCVK
jgi:hypothetical protein